MNTVDLTQQKPFSSFGEGLLILLIYFGISSVTGIFPFVAGLLGAKTTLPWLYLGAQVSATLLTLWVSCRMAKMSVKDCIPHQRVEPLLWPMILMAGLGFVIISNGVDGIQNAILPCPEFIQKLFKEMGWPAVVIGAPLGEEILFRGFLLTAFLRRYTPGKAIFYSALLFGLIHLNPWQVPIAFGMGLLFGWLTVKTGSIWPAVLVHFVNNGLAWLGMHSDVKYLSGNGMQPLWVWAIGLGLAGVGFYVLWAWFKKRDSNVDSLEIRGDVEPQMS